MTDQTKDRHSYSYSISIPNEAEEINKQKPVTVQLGVGAET